MYDDLENLNFDEFYDEAKKQSIEDTQLTHPAFLKLSTQEEKYIEKALIGSGGMKKVTRVYDTHTRRDVALASLHENSSRELCDHFIYEAWLSAQLDHPNIIKILELAVDKEGRPYFTMDLKKGSDLKETLKASPDEYSVKDRLEIFLKICDAISYAHSKNILHLDLKPANIQIARYGEVIVCDWGLGKMTASTDITAANIDQELLNSELLLKARQEKQQCQGTPGYMPPEQITAEEAPSKLSDIYGLGALLYYTLTLTAPLSGELQEILKKTRTGRITEPKDIAPKIVTPGLNAIIMRAMALSSKNRYQTVEGLRKDIHSYLMGFSPNAENSSFSKELLLFYKRNKAICLSLMGFFFLTFSLASFFIYTLNQSRREELFAKKEAQKNLALIKDSQKKISTTLQLYQQEKQTVNRAIRNHSQDLYSSIVLLSDPEFNRKPVETINLALTKLNNFLAIAPRDRDALTHKAYLLFMAQQYKKASIILKDRPIASLAPLSELISSLNLENTHNLSTEKFRQIIESYSKLAVSPSAAKMRQEFISKAATFDFAKRRQMGDFSSYTEVVRTLLKAYNPQWNSQNFHYDAERKSLKVYGSGLLHFSKYNKFLKAPSPEASQDLPLIRFLEIDQLSLKHTSFSQLEELESLNIKSLNIIQTKITNLDALRKFKNLEELIIENMQFPKEELDKVSKGVELIRYPYK